MFEEDPPKCFKNGSHHIAPTHHHPRHNVMKLNFFILPLLLHYLFMFQGCAGFAFALAKKQFRRRPTTVTRAMSVQGAAGRTTDDQTNAAERRSKGEFVRGVSSARHWISKTAPSDKDAPHYPPAADRYHMIVAYNCPVRE